MIADDVYFFVGTEVENTKFVGQFTLFVATRFLDIEQIKSIVLVNQKIRHVYLGASKVYRRHPPTVNEVCKIHNIAMDLIEFGLNVTVDLPYEIWAQSKFLGWSSNYLEVEPRYQIMVSIEMPNINNRIAIKIDDQVGKPTNSGVWTFSIDQLPKSCYTSWDEYESDVPIE